MIRVTIIIFLLFPSFVHAFSKDDVCPITVYADFSTKKHITDSTGPFADSPDGRGYKRMAEFFEDRNLCFKMQYTSWQRVIRSAEMDPNGLIFLILRTEEREDNFHWITELTDKSYPVYLFSYDPSGKGPDMAASNKQAICPINGAQCGMLRKNGFNENEIMEIPRDAGENILEMVFRGRGQYFIDHQSTVDLFLKDKTIVAGSLVKVKEIPLKGTYLAASKSIDPALLEKLQ